MEYDLAVPLFERPALPADYRATKWDDRLLESHAEVKYRCFRCELDANVFPSLATRSGCQRLMVDIARRSGFVPQASRPGSGENAPLPNAPKPLSPPAKLGLLPPPPVPLGLK